MLVDSESEASWREFFISLRQIGLRGNELIVQINTADSIVPFINIFKLQR
jgi:transposase-like protein